MPSDLTRRTRRLVGQERILRKDKNPPDAAEGAVGLVLQQAAVLSDAPAGPKHRAPAKPGATCGQEKSARPLSDLALSSLAALCGPCLGGPGSIQLPYERSEGCTLVTAEVTASVTR